MQFVDHPELEVSNLFEPQFFGVFSKPHSKSIDVVGVGVDGPWREVSKLHVFSHAFCESSDTLFVRSHKPVSNPVTESKLCQSEQLDWRHNSG